ncbi:RDD family protein [Cellulomonas bogoriensis]|uniref:RDD domain-containing protein n=1 Tax=Cellulomonas bogoriensis 69B4 = DSM 16987 TaxID=1386082 RepID=A0A0A0BXF0_9CELL|nr:RDD family protein [Cellulomonas bogoriensis]KGM13083.1 hypothetical protein N869_16320 [Cellulomonas bogoriensis 69B4 = DSM 16987]
MSDEIVIGEGVVLDQRPASFATRAVGAVIDLLALAAVGLVAVLIGAPLITNVDPAAAAALTIALVVTVLVILPATVETLTRGRSLGKVTMGLRVVRDDGGPVRVRHATIRSLVGVGEVILTVGSVALIASIVHPQSKRLGDMLAGTYSVRVRGGQRALPPLVMPPELAAWAAGTDIRRLPDGLALSVRQFLGRATTLHVASRIRLGHDLAGEVERYVAPGPPPGTHPERFLSAVLAERREREFAHSSRAADAAAAEAKAVRRLPHAVPDPAD